MTLFIVVRMFLHLFAGMAICAFRFPFMARPARQALIRRWSGQLVAICGLKIVIRQGGAGGEIGSGTGDGTQSQALMVANHVSWLDIFVINSLEPCRFVAKSDIRSWPLVGWLCAKTGTIFISRGKRSAVRAIYQDLVQSIKAGDRITFFPEGTTAAQGGMLPFHANLFEAAIDAKVPIQPYALRYLDDSGALHDAADFIGDTTIVDSILAILKARSSRRITAELTVLAPIASAGLHRRELAQAVHDAIATSLGYAVPEFSRAAPVADSQPESASGPQGIAQ